MVMGPISRVVFGSTAPRSPSTGAQRVVWDMETVRGESGSQLTGVCTVDETTGRILAMSCVPSWEEIAAIGDTPLRSFVSLGENEQYNYATDNGAGDWNAFLDQATTQAETFLAQTGLDQELAGPPEPVFEGNQLLFVLQYEDGGTGRMELTWSILEHQYGDEDPYPGK